MKNKKKYKFIIFMAFTLFLTLTCSYSQADSTKNLGLIVFAKQISGGYSDIFTIFEDGTREKNITNTPDSDESFPVWSPDGMTIAFQKQVVVEPEGEPTRIYLMDKDGKNLRPLIGSEPNNFQFQPTWSPDGSKIAYIQTNPEVFKIANFKSSNGVTTTFQNNEIRYIVWSPTRNIFAGECVSVIGICLMRTDGTDLYRLNQVGQWFGGIHWSPNGKKLAASKVPEASNSNLSAIYTLDIDGKKQKRLTFNLNNADDVWPDWSADGSKIVFVRTKREQNDGFYTSNLFIINSDGTKEKQLTFETSFSGARTPDWRPSLDK